MAPPVPPVSANRGEATRPPREQSTLYKLVVTPLVLVSFLVSLALVDIRHSALRAHFHADAGPEASRLPRWLHRVVYRYRRYEYGGAAVSPAVTPGSPGTPGRTPGGGSGAEAEDYYHSKQRKLMKMEAEEAFEMRGTVLVVLSLLSLGVLWVLWRVVSWGLGVAVRAWISGES